MCSASARHIQHRHRAVATFQRVPVEGRAAHLGGEEQQPEVLDRRRLAKGILLRVLVVSSLVDTAEPFSWLRCGCCCRTRPA